MTISRYRLEQLLASYAPRLYQEQSGRQSAVLVPIIEADDGSFDLLLTKRTDRVEHHKGQISFPGGAADPQDESLTATALREAFEEIGLPEDAVRVLGVLDQVWTPSGFLITPIVGIIDSPMPLLAPSPAEVEEILIVPLEHFFDESRLHTELRIVQGAERTVYFFDVATEPVWGATALIIHRLVNLIRANSEE